MIQIDVCHHSPFEIDKAPCPLCLEKKLRARLEAAERVMLKCAMVMQWVIDDDDTEIYRTDLEGAIKEIDEWKKGQTK